MMKTTIERLGDDRLRLDIEVPEEVLNEALDITLKALARDMALPGFRPGKVPPQAVLQRIGREAAIAQTIEAHIDGWYRDAVMSSGIRPVALPEIDFPGDGTPGSGPLVIQATVSVAPKPTIPDLSTIEVERPNLPDIQQYVDQVLEATLRGAGTLIDTGVPAVAGDEVVVDFHCTVDGEQVAGAAATGYEARLGDGRLLDELERAIIGQQAGSTLEVPVDFEADHPMPDLAGRNATFHVEVREVKRMELPELTDEVAGKVSEYSTSEELLADIRSSITARLEQEIAGIFRANAVTKVAEVAELAEPEVLVEQRQQEMYQNLKQQLLQSGMTVEAWLDRSGKDMEGLFSELGQSARDDLRRELVLLALAEEAGIIVTDDDLRAEVAEHVEHTGEDPGEAMERIRQSGRIGMLQGELLIQRTIDHLVSQVKPVAVDLPVAPSEQELDAAGETGDKSATGGQEASE